jgi:hypothetical protein
MMTKSSITMAKKEQVNEVTEPVVTPTPAPGIVDLTKRVKVVYSDKAPYHKKDQESMVSQALADKIVANGWGKISK